MTVGVPAGILLVPVLAIITVSDPLVSIALGYFWLDENFASTPCAVAGEGLALLVLTAGIIILAHRAPMITRQLQARTDRNASGGGQGK
jgi:hypothetical protein